MDDIEVLEVEDSKMYQEYYGKILKYLDKTIFTLILLIFIKKLA